MDVVIPPNVVEALLGGGLVALSAAGSLEWLKSREWFPVKSGDILILWSVGLGVFFALLFWSLGWVTGDVTLVGALGFGVASGFGASVLRDLVSNVIQSRQTVVMMDSADVSAEQLAAAVKELDDEHKLSE